jgi:flagellar basal-body rod modification protein FlgD
MSIAGATGPSSNTQFVDAQSTGFAAMTSETFLQLLITELQNQDPTAPIGNEELLNQLAMMRNLESNLELGEAIEAITTNQQLSTAATFIGKAVTGTTVDQEPVTGIVDRAFMQDGAVFVGVGDQEVPLANVASVHLPEAD